MSKAVFVISSRRRSVTVFIQHYIDFIFSRFSQNCEKRLLTSRLSAALYACPSAWKNSGPTGRIFAKFDIWVIYNLTNDCTIISNTVITNNMLLRVLTFKMSSSESSLCPVKITYRFSGLSKIKLLKYEMINFNKMLIVQRDKRFV